MLSQIIEHNVPIHVKKQPFRHIVVDNFFTKNFYNELCVEFYKIMRRGLSEEKRRDMLSRSQRSYDAYNWVINPKCGRPLDIFFSREWEEFITGTFGITSSKDTLAAFHHHQIGSNDGWVHSDFSLCSFKEDRLANGINPWHYQCDYEDSSPDKQPDTIKRMRSIAIIYYLFNNPRWEEGDGGETALYKNKTPDSLASKIVPLNNRLLVFEVSPFSFHTFLKNNKYERNTIIQWFHQDPMITGVTYPGYEYGRW